MDVHIPQCCDEFARIDFRKMSAADMQVVVDDKNLWCAVAWIAFNPLYWNVIARWEYRSRFLSRLFGSGRLPCVILALSILLLNAVRSTSFHTALHNQPKWYLMQNNATLWSGYACILLGGLLVISSFIKLGFFGTFLGDYFGIYMDAKVTDFPFNIIADPMYWGSTLTHFGYSCVFASQAGLLLTTWIAVVYKIAIAFEGPFTEAIYRKRDEDNKKDN